jgi:hypothetical protein
MLLQRVAAGAGQAEHLAHGDPAVLPGLVDDLQRQRGQGREQRLFALDGGGEAALLLPQ